MTTGPSSDSSRPTAGRVAATVGSGAGRRTLATVGRTAGGYAVTTKIASRRQAKRRVCSYCGQRPSSSL